MLRSFVHHVGQCCMMLAHVAWSLKPVKLFAQHLPTFLLFSWSMKHVTTCWVRLHGSHNIVGLARAHWMLHATVSQRVLGKYRSQTPIVWTLLCQHVAFVCTGLKRDFTVADHHRVVLATKIKPSCCHDVGFHPFGGAAHVLPTGSARNNARSPEVWTWSSYTVNKTFSPFLCEQPSSTDQRKSDYRSKFWRPTSLHHVNRKTINV